MASSVAPERKHEVFLSFRGTDTRFGFLGHLRLALSQEKIDYFVDDQNLQQGDEISPALIAAIEKSEISVVILSENYASSTWCLEELAHIMKRKECHEQTVIPVFYNVDPSSVRYRKRSYEEAFARHEQRYDQDRIQKWRDALEKVAGLSGFHSKNYQTEADLITEVVKSVLKKLNTISHPVPDDLQALVGIQEPIAYLETLLRKKSQNFLMIGIWGTGGIGKTTIATVLFKRLCNEYEGRCFVPVREGQEKCRTTQIKKEILSELFNEDLYSVMNPDCERRCRQKKVLLVLDDIHKLMQVETLIERCQWFGPNSRIIVTSRNKDAIKKCDFIYEVNQLSFEKALQLFNLHALPEVCLDKEHEWYKLSKLIVDYTGGNPLGIKVLGSSLRGREKNEWESKLKKLDKILDPDIQDVLQLSYNDLDDEGKDIFLYLACFFEGDSKERIISLLDDDNCHTIDGLRVLQDRALIIISASGIVWMHDLVQKMGHEIVRKKCTKNPGQYIHLWDSNDIYEVLKNNKGTEEIESISLKMWRLEGYLRLRPEAFARMENIKLLKFQRNVSYECRSKVYVPNEGIIIPSRLRSLQWDCYPSKSLQLGFCVDNLVELRMTHSRLKRLWDGSQEFVKLKIIDLSDSKELVEFPSLSNAPNLKEINLTQCSSLVELNLMGCDKLVDVGSGHISSTSITSEILEEPVYNGLRSLRILYLGYCHSLAELKFGHLPSLQELDLIGTNVETLPTSIQYSSRLKRLYMHECRKLRSLPELPPSIEIFGAYGCSSLETPFPSLQYNLVDLTMSQSTLRRLRDIGMQEFPELKYLSLSCPVIKFLDLSIAPNLEVVWLVDCISLVELNLMRCDKLEDVGSGHISSASITSEISEEHVYTGLRSLKVLHLEGCHSLTKLKLAHLPSLKEFWEIDCPSLKILSPSLQNNLVRLTMQRKNVRRFWDGVQEFPKLNILDLSYSEEVIEFLDLLNAPNLRVVNLSGTGVETLPTNIVGGFGLYKSFLHPLKIYVSRIAHPSR